MVIGFKHIRVSSGNLQSFTKNNETNDQFLPQSSISYVYGKC